ncbi:MAG TPA: hypothetical protein VGO43_13835, partial [Pyrinomonadaceae bacterium]|nr:hypothetical protein [Pyrinomonadaceae bacterium]
MSASAENTSSFDPTIQSEDIAFSPDELVTCSHCGRSNAPNRLQCMYCGNALDVEPAAVGKPILRVLETWERGFNLILPAGERLVEPNAIAEVLSIGPEQALAMLASGTSLPIARVESERIADLLLQKASTIGLSLRVISDDDLLSEKLPVRLGGMEMGDDGVTLTDFNTAATH